MIRKVLSFFDNIVTKIPGTIQEDYSYRYVPNKYETCLKGDIAEIYVSAEGNDNNSGFSENNPIATLDRGFEIMKDYGFSSVHFYLMTATNFYMTDYKNVAGCSIHFHTRADGVNLHIVNNATAEKHEYDYTAFYGNHYNFGNTRKLTPGDDYNITQKMNIIFHSNERASYFEGCTVIFNACRIFQNDNTPESLTSTTLLEHYAHPIVYGTKYTGFSGCPMAQFNQCVFYDELTFVESNAYFLDCDFYLRNDSEAFIYGRNSKFLFRMGHTGDAPNYTARWSGAHAYAFRFNNNNLLDDSKYASADNLIYGMGCEFNFYDGIGIFIAGRTTGIGAGYIGRAITLRNSILTANSQVVTGGDSGISAIDSINHYNTDRTYHTLYNNTLTCSTVNGVYKNAFTGDLG